MGDETSVPMEIRDAGGGIRLTDTATHQVRSAARRDDAGRRAGGREPRMAGGPSGGVPTANGASDTDRLDEAATERERGG